MRIIGIHQQKGIIYISNKKIGYWPKSFEGIDLEVLRKEAMEWRNKKIGGILNKSNPSEFEKQALFWFALSYENIYLMDELKKRRWYKQWRLIKI